MMPEDADDPVGDAVRTVAGSLAEAKQLLMEHAKEMGIDLEAAAHDPEVEEGIERRRVTVENTDAVQLAHAYAFEVRPLFESTSEWLPAEADDPMIEEMLEILQWYHFFIAAKIHRGYHGIVDLDGDEDVDELRDTQSDANGSIKIALIALERSILAWTYLLNKENADLVRPEIDRLESIKSMVETKFPHAREFIRPGFDEIDAVM